MKRTVLPVAMLLTISVICAGMVIGASSEAKDPTTAITHSPSMQATGVSETAEPRIAADPVITTIQLTPQNDAGNWRHPGVAEDSKGNRLAIFRGPEGTKYYYAYCPKGGTWSTAAVIAPEFGQPTLISSLYATVDVDSSDLFHCYWENANGAVYCTFKSGVWTAPFRPALAGRYDLTSGMAIRSNDEIVTVDCEVTGWDKEIYLHRKGKNDTIFGTPFNISRDGQIASTQPHLAIDSKDHIWAVWKSDFLHDHLEENLVIYLSEFGLNSEDVNDWIMVSPDPGWSFLAQVAVNSEDKVMAEFASSTMGQYMSRLYDPATKKLGPMIPLNLGLPYVPWHTFFSRMVARGKDFYVAAMNAGRALYLLKFDETASKWNIVAQISDRGVEMFALYSGYDNMLVAWNSNEEPSAVFLTTVSVTPYSKIRIKSVSNLVVVKQTERGFFRGYTLNGLTWEANPENSEKGIVVTAHRVYRKGRTEAYSKWERITEVTADIFKYGDRNIPADSDYVYAVTCVDDKGNESTIY
jgi:hypothetical protein